jgi:hypothetical protein
MKIVFQIIQGKKPAIKRFYSLIPDFHGSLKHRKSGVLIYPQKKRPE